MPPASTSPASTNRRRLVRVARPALTKERPERYYPFAAELLEREFGRRVSRNTLHKYMTRGFPVRKGGPYVQVPVVKVLGRAMTTREAMQRFMDRVRRLETAEAGAAVRASGLPPRKRPRPRKRARATATA